MKRTHARALVCAALLSAVALAGPARSAQNVSFACEKSVVYDASTNGATKLVSKSQSGGIYICGYVIATQAAVTVKLEYGTGTTCATGETALTPAWAFAVTTVGASVVADSASYYRGLSVPPANDLCLKTSAGSAVQAIVYYSQQTP